MWTDVAQALGALGALLISGIGTAVIWYQIRQVERAIKADTLEKLYMHGLEIVKHMAEHPETRPYIFEGRELSADDPSRAQVLAILEMTTDYLQHIALQRENIGAKQWEYWCQYGRDVFRHCPAATKYLQERGHWYTPELFELLGQRERVTGYQKIESSETGVNSDEALRRLGNESA